MPGTDHGRCGRVPRLYCIARRRLYKNMETIKERNRWMDTTSTTTIENDELIPIVPGSTLSKEEEGDSAGLPIPKEEGGVVLSLFIEGMLLLLGLIFESFL